MKTVAIAVAAAGIVGGVKATGWESWNTTSSVDPATKSTSTSASTETETWAEWTSTEDPATTTTTSSAVDWAAWEASTSTVTSEDPATTTTSTEVWGAWDEATTYTTKTGTITVTKTVLPKKTSSTVEASTVSSSSVAVVTSTVVPAWSHAGWFGDAWSSSADGQCVMNVVTSYGHPIWKPTPDPTTVIVPVVPTPVANSTAWEVWSTTKSSVSSVKVDPSSSTSSSSSTVSTASTESSTSTETWAVWTGSVSAAAFYSAPASSSAPAPSSASASASSSVAKASSTASSGGKGGASISSNGNSWAMTYSPYTASSGCKDAATINADIAKLAAKGFSSVRVYSTDCSTLAHVGAAARANNIKIILGVFISSSGISGAQSQVDDIVAWAEWDLVELIVVGNEAVFNGFCSASALAGFISSSKTAFKGAGYSGSVTTTEDLATWQSIGSQLCDAVDVVAANLYAFFNPNTKAAEAGTFIQAEIAELGAICGNKETYVMESGWPSSGACNGVACPGKDEQATAIKAIQGAVGSKIVFFSFEDELWKTPGVYGVEQHWGCADVF